MAEGDEQAEGLGLEEPGHVEPGRAEPAQGGLGS